MEQYQHALNLLIPMWRGLAADYKRKYARNIWEQFENQIKSAAYTATLPRFISNLCLKLPINIRASDLDIVNQAVTLCDEHTLLKQFRTEATLLVLFVRQDNERRKAEQDTES